MGRRRRNGRIVKVDGTLTAELSARVRGRLSMQVGFGPLRPGRIDTLLDALDMEREGLEAVKAAAEAGDKAAACHAQPTARHTRHSPGKRPSGNGGNEV